MKGDKASGGLAAAIDIQQQTRIQSAAYPRQQEDASVAGVYHQHIQERSREV